MVSDKIIHRAFTVLELMQLSINKSQNPLTFNKLHVQKKKKKKKSLFE